MRVAGEGEQRDAVVNVDKHHVANFSEDEEKDSYSEDGEPLMRDVWKR